MTGRDPGLDVRPGHRWLVAVAHPRRRVVRLRSAIARAAAPGAEVTVACATRGEAGEPRPGNPGDGDLGAAREAELHRAAAHLGAARVELLGYRDSGSDGHRDQRHVRAAVAEHRSQTSPYDGPSPELRRASLDADHLTPTTWCAPGTGDRSPSGRQAVPKVSSAPCAARRPDQRSTAMTAPTGTPERAAGAPPRRTRPATEYWDVFTASWRRRDPVVPAPRRGD